MVLGGKQKLKKELCFALTDMTRKPERGEVFCLQVCMQRGQCGQRAGGGEGGEGVGGGRGREGKAGGAMSEKRIRD